MLPLLRILFAIVLLVSSSVSLSAMASEGAVAHGGQVHGIEGVDHRNVDPAGGHDGLDCGMAVCCFMFATAEPIAPADCSLASPQTDLSVPDLPDRADPHEHPPRQG